MRRFFLLATAFICGFCIMGLELLGFRLFAPTFGYSTYVWGSLIGMVLAALSVGYIVGGRLADRKPYPAVLFKVIIVAGVYLLVVVLVYKSVLDFCFIRFGTIYGSLTSTIAIYGLPMVLLSMASPFIIRLLTEKRKIGEIAGRVYGISTIGSILGTLITPFYLIYVLGVRDVLILFAGLVLVVGVVGVVASNLKWALTLILLAVVPFSPPKKEKNEVLNRESFYNDIKVFEEDGVYRLRVNWWTSYSVSIKDEYLTKHYYDYFMLGPLLTRGKEILVLGMAAGTTVKQYQKFFPDAHIDAVEIDPEIIKIAKDKRYFGLEEGRNVKIYTRDARPFLRTCKKKYDVVELDMFQGGPYIPFYVTTKEFFELVNEHCNEDAVVIMNVLSLGDDKTLVSSVGKTLQAVFPKVYEVELARSSNIILFAFKKDVSLQDIQNLLEKNRRVELEELARRFSAQIRPLLPYPRAHIFTDDKADVEWLTFKIVEEHVINKKRGR